MRYARRAKFVQVQNIGSRLFNAPRPVKQRRIFLYDRYDLRRNISARLASLPKGHSLLLTLLPRQKRRLQCRKLGQILRSLRRALAYHDPFERQYPERDAIDSVSHRPVVLDREYVQPVAVSTTSIRSSPSPPNAGGCMPKPEIQKPPASLAASRIRSSVVLSNHTSRSCVAIGAPSSKAAPMPSRMHLTP